MLSSPPLSKPHRLPPVKKKQPSARGPSGEVGYPPHRLRGASRPAVFQWQLGVFPDTGRLDKQRGPGCPRRRFGYFAAEGKVTRAGARNTPKQPEGLIKGDSEGLSSDKIPSPPGSGSKSFPPGGNHFSPIAPLPGQIGPWMQKPPGFSVGICPLFFYRLLKCSRIVLY